MWGVLDTNLLYSWFLLGFFFSCDEMSFMDYNLQIISILGFIQKNTKKYHKKHYHLKVLAHRPGFHK